MGSAASQRCLRAKRSITAEERGKGKGTVESMEMEKEKEKEKEKENKKHFNPLFSVKSIGSNVNRLFISLTRTIVIDTPFPLPFPFQALTCCPNIPILMSVVKAALVDSPHLVASASSLSHRRTF